MKLSYQKTFFYILMSLLICFSYQSQGFSQNTASNKEKIFSHLEKINFASEEYRLKVNVFKENTDDGLSMWSEWTVSNPREKYKLECGLSSMIQITDVKVSQSSKYLAIVSVGEGHPFLDLIDLQALLQNKECKILASINPYPGIINIEKWQNDKLIVTSSALLTHQIDEQYPIEFMTTEQERFLFDPETQVFKALSANAKNPTNYFIKLLSDSENKLYAIDVLGLLKEPQAIANLERMLSKEIDPEVIEKLNASIKKINQ